MIIFRWGPWFQKLPGRGRAVTLLALRVRLEAAWFQEAVESN